MFLHHIKKNFFNPLTINICSYYLRIPLLSHRNYSYKGKLRWLTRKTNILNMSIKEPLVWIDCEVNLSKALWLNY